MDCLSRKRPLCDNMATLSDTYLDVGSSAKDAERLSKLNTDVYSSAEDAETLSYTDFIEWNKLQIEIMKRQNKEI